MPSFKGIHWVVVLLIITLILSISGCKSSEERAAARAAKVADSLAKVAKDSVEYFTMVKENYFNGKVADRTLLTDKKGKPTALDIHATSSDEDYYFRIDYSFPLTWYDRGKYFKYGQFREMLATITPPLTTMYHQLSPGADIIILSSRKFSPNAGHSDISKFFVHHDPNNIPERYQEIILRHEDLLKIVKE